MFAPALPLAQTVDAQEIFRELRAEQQQGVALTLREALTLALELPVPSSWSWIKPSGVCVTRTPCPWVAS
jgi:hypothetical protein